MAFGKVIFGLYVLTQLYCHVSCQRSYDMDKLSTCGSTINVDDNGVNINARGVVSPSNPPLQCIVYLRSRYSRDDGSNKLQIEVLSRVIKDQAITVDIFEGRTSVGRYIKRLSHREGATNVFYSQTNEITIRLNRPDVLYQPEYRFSLLIKPWKDRNVLTPNDGKEVLSTGAVIGLVFGCLFLIALIILFCWCCCTGRVTGIKRRLGGSKKNSSGFVKSGNSSSGLENRAVVSEKGKPGVINFNDPRVWNTVVSRTNENQQTAPRYYQRNNNNRYDSRNGGGNADYEPYDYERQQRAAVAQPYRRDGRNNYNQRYGPSRNPQEDSTTRENRERQPTKETLIDDVFDSDSAKHDEDTATNSDVEDATLQKRRLGEEMSGSPRQGRRGETTLPEETDLDGSPQLERYKSMDLQSQPDLDTISSPHHVNAGVRASVEDEEISPTSSLRKQQKGQRSPRSKRARGREPDPLAMPPEAFEPIFSGPISGIDYPGYSDEPPPAYPGGFMPYGLIPAMQFAPAAPGAQTYAYAYQTAPQGGPPATQGAYMVQNVPTSDGNRRTAFAVEQTLSPDKSNLAGSPRDRRRKNSDPFRHNDTRGSGGSKKNRGKDRDHDLAVITRGAAPPDPGQGHRSVAMKSGTDPDSGIQTTQVVWTDSLPDPTDPKPGENPQVTRKTITRVTTKSGHGDLPPEPQSILELNNQEEPAFLSPTPTRTAHSLSPSHPNAAIAYTPDRGNIAFYTGASSAEVPPERSSTPNSVHHPVSYSKAIRDRIPLDDSTV